MEAATSVRVPALEPRVIRPASRRPTLGLREVWRHRELLYFFAWRELKVRYKQAALGAAWAILQPLGYMVVLTLFFSRVVKIYAVGPYPVIALSGVVIWLFFANSVTLASASLTGNAALLTKVYFPRLLAPLAPVFAAIIDLALATVVLLAVMARYGIFPAPQRVWAAGPAVLLAMAAAIGIGAWFAAVNVKYRDVRYVVPFILQLGFLGSGVVMSFVEIAVPDPWSTILWLNPMLGAVETFRWSMMGGVRPEVSELFVSGLGGLVVFVGGVVYFKRLERVFADVV